VERGIKGERLKAYVGLTHNCPTEKPMFPARSGDLEGTKVILAKIKRLEGWQVRRFRIHSRLNGLSG